MGVKHSLIDRQKLEGSVDDWIEGYKKEVKHMLTRRLRLLGPSEAMRVRREHALGRLRMLLELKEGW